MTARAPLLPVLCALCALVVCPAGGEAAKPLRPGDAARLIDARASLDGALKRLAEAADPSAEQRAAEQALIAIEALVDTYHHAPNLRDRDMRVHALDLRPVVGRLFAPDGPLVLVDDVIHPRRAVATALADAAGRVGDWPGRVRWLRAALATAPDDRALLSTLRDALVAAGDLPGAAAVAARLNAGADGSTAGAPKGPAPR